MAYVFGKIKCCFCHRKNGVIHSVCDYGIYGEVGKRKFYHPECIEMVELDPEKFGHKLIDIAIHINELRKQNISNCNRSIVERFNEKVDRLHQSSFERMMPKR